jgi:hypothetical protein
MILLTEEKCFENSTMIKKKVRSNEQDHRKKVQREAINEAKIKY